MLLEFFEKTKLCCVWARDTLIGVEGFSLALGVERRRDLGGRGVRVSSETTPQA